MKNLSSFLDIIKKRRSIYVLGNKEEISQEKIEDIIKTVLKYVPTAFNSQSGRVLILWNSESKKFWQCVKEALQKIVPSDKFSITEAKVNSFANGFGTILFFEDMSVIKDLETKYPLYQENFKNWSLQANGMLQFAVWSALAEIDIGASLQHYNPLIDSVVAEMWHIPASWKLLAQMPFGHIEKAADEKTFLPLDERLKIYK